MTSTRTHSPDELAATQALIAKIRRAMETSAIGPESQASALLTAFGALLNEYDQTLHYSLIGDGEVACLVMGTLVAIDDHWDSLPAELQDALKGYKRGSLKGYKRG